MMAAVCPVPNRSSAGSADLWLLLCLVAASLAWLLSVVVEARVDTGAAPAELAIGRGLPFLSDELHPDARSIRFVDDVADVVAEVAAGRAAVGIDAGPSGVLIVHRSGPGAPEPALVAGLKARWSGAEVRRILPVEHPTTIAAGIVLVLLLNAGAWWSLRELRRLRRGLWLRWMAMTGRSAAGLLTDALLGRAIRMFGLGVAVLGGLLGLESLPLVLPIAALVTVTSVWMAVLLAVAGRIGGPLCLALQIVLGMAALLILRSAQVGPAGWLVLTTTAGVLVGLSLVARHRLAGWIRGGPA